MTAWACRCMRRDWSAGSSFGHLRPTALFPSQPRSSATCSKGSIGEIHNEPGGRSWQADVGRTGGKRICVHAHAGMCSESHVDRLTDALPDDIDALKAALLAERTARIEMEARASGAEAMVAHLKLLIAKMKRDRFGASAERSRRLLDQLEMELEELEITAAENEASVSDASSEHVNVRPFT